ncbi:hypothetical protein MHK_009361 [Candidatus Magnetomorum sp. HK-1]|nr:hypothetical protein MHK_009361 [Candidatus Magnetomorum sp. HK-1]
MKKNTFKQYLTVLIPFSAELDKMNDETLRVKKEIELLRVQHDRLSNLKDDRNLEPEKVRQKNNKDRHGLDKVRQKNEKVRHGLDSFSKISGWNVRKSNDGYYRCYRKLKRKVHCIYIGKTLDRNKAIRRIIAKERHLGLDKG